MDIRAQGWFAKMLITNCNLEPEYSGSLMGIVGSILRDLQAQQLSKTMTRTITIQISNNPINGNLQDSIRIEEINAQLIHSPLDLPVQFDSLESAYNSFIEDGLSPVAAHILACDSMGVEPNPEMLHWLQDSTAKEFRHATVSDVAFESMGTARYEQLRAILQKQYPWHEDFFARARKTES